MCDMPIPSGEYFDVDMEASGELGAGPFTYVKYDVVDQDSVPLNFCVRNQVFATAKAVVANRRKLADRLLDLCAGWFLVSQAAREVMRALQCCDSIRWIKTAVHHKDDTWLADYRLAYAIKWHDVWDYSRSDFYWQPGKTRGTKEAAGYMREGVVDTRLVPDFDLFEVQHWYWIGTRRLRDAIESHGLTGFEFKPLKT